MRIAVVGAGIVGIASAWELAADGHQVTVFERRGSAAAEASFANAGIAAPGWTGPWGVPGAAARGRARLLARRLRLRPPFDAALLPWLWRCWSAPGRQHASAQHALVHRLALYSRERLHAITNELGLAYERRPGCLVLLRRQADLAAARPALALLAELGTAFELLDAEGCRRIEPGLNANTALRAGIHLPQAEVANCRQFALLLRGHAERLGVRVRLNSAVQALRPGPLLTWREQAPGAEFASHHGAAPAGKVGSGVPVEEAFDAVVLCAALGAGALLRPLGLALPLIAVQASSVTAPLRVMEQFPDLGPRAALIDEGRGVSISRLGNRVRVAGGAEIGGAPGALRAGAVERLHRELADWFPGAAQLDQAQSWTGASAALPDGPPLVGASGIEGVWINLGHGAQGWELACGTARILADALAGRAPQIDAEGLGTARLRR